MAFVIILSPFSFPIPYPTTLGPNIPRVLFPRPQPLGTDPPPRSWARGGDPYDWRTAAPTLFHFVLTAACSMLRQNLTPGLAPSQHPCTQPHSTPTSSPPTFLHPIAISILAVNSLSRARCWASSQKLLRIERHPTSTQLTPLTPQTPNPHTPWQSIHKSLGCNPLLPSPKSVRLLGVHRHRTGWRLVGAPFRSTLQTV